MARPLAGVLLALAALIVLALGWGEVFAPLVHTTFGASLVPGPQGAAVARVQPHSKAAALGLRPGDGVDVSALSLSDRYRLMVAASPDGTAVTVPIVRGGIRKIVTFRAQNSAAIGARQPPVPVALLANVTISLLIVALIALRRPSLATAALVLYGTGAVTTYAVIAQFTWLPNPLFGFAGVFVNTAFATLPLLALLPFLARFPEAPATPTARLRMHVADGIFIAGAILLTLEAIYEPLTFQSWPVVNAAQAFIVVPVFVFAAASYREASGENRRRIAWALVGFAVSAVAYAAWNVLGALYQSAPFISPLLATLQVLQSALPVALAYAILRHRVIDVGFALNRTIVYAVITTLAVVVVSSVDWLGGRLLSGQRMALAVEAFVAISFGFALNFIHGWTERFIDRVVFRQRHIASKHIEYRIGALAFAASSDAVDEALAHDAPQILDLSSAAVFSREASSGPFQRRASTGWSAETVAALEDDSLLLRTLRSVERPIFLDDAAIALSNVPVGITRPVLAIPIVTQHELIGFALYGSHRDGASLDSEEVSLLARLTAAAGNAYGAVEARRWRERVAALEESMRALQTAPLRRTS